MDSLIWPIIVYAWARNDAPSCCNRFIVNLDKQPKDGFYDFEKVSGKKILENLILIFRVSEFVEWVQICPNGSKLLQMDNTN